MGLCSAGYIIARVGAYHWEVVGPIAEYAAKTRPPINKSS